MLNITTIFTATFLWYSLPNWVRAAASIAPVDLGTPYCRVTVLVQTTAVEFTLVRVVARYFTLKLYFHLPYENKLACS